MERTNRYQMCVILTIHKIYISSYAKYLFIVILMQHYMFQITYAVLWMTKTLFLYVYVHNFLYTYITRYMYITYQYYITIYCIQSNTKCKKCKYAMSLWQCNICTACTVVYSFFNLFLHGIFCISTFLCSQHKIVL